MSYPGIFEGTCDLCHRNPRAVGNGFLFMCFPCSGLPRLPAFATTMAPFDSPVPMPAQLPRTSIPWEAVEFTTVTNTRACVLWRCTVVAPEPELPETISPPPGDT